MQAVLAAPDMPARIRASLFCDSVGFDVDAVRASSSTSSASKVRLVRTTGVEHKTHQRTQRDAFDRCCNYCGDLRHRVSSHNLVTMLRKVCRPCQRSRRWIVCS